MPSARPSFSTLRRVGHCLISIRRTIVSSLRPKRKCGTHDAARLPNPVLKRPRGPQRPALNSLGSMTANPGVVPPAEARQSWTGETESHARTYRLHNIVRSQGALRRSTRNGPYRDVCPRDCRRSAGAVACAATNRPITARRMASLFVAQPFYRGPRAHLSLSRRRRLVQV